MRTRLYTLLATALFASTLWGQAQFGEIDGRVLDPSGAAIPNVPIVATETETGFITKTESTGAGEFVLGQLRPGSYHISAQAAGFKKLEREGVIVRVADRLNLNLNLDVGETSTTVIVSGNASLLRTGDAQEGEVIDQTDIMRLPVVDHEPLELLRLSSDFQGDGQKVSHGNGLENRINGGRPLGIEYFVDGVAVETGLSHSTVDNTPTMQDTSEFKVVTNGISAEYGRLSGGFVEVVTKSGSNEFHGQAFEYDQNRSFNANSWGQNAQGQPQGVFQYNLYGAALGGPVVLPRVYNGRNKTFFYFDYQGTRNNHGSVGTLYSEPTAAMRMGDLSGVQVNGVPARIYDQNSMIVCTDTRTNTTTPYNPSTCPVVQGTDALGNPTDIAGPARSGLIADGVHLPSSLFDPISAAIMKLLPLPNRTADANCTFCNNYQGFYNAHGDDERYSARIDQIITANQRLYGRFAIENNSQIPQSAPAGPLSAATVNTINNGSSFNLDYTWSISPTFLFEARGGYYFNPYFSGSSINPTAAAEIPVSQEIRSLIGPTNYPWTIISGFPTSIVDNGYNGYTNDTTYQANLSLTKILGRHTIKTGYEHRRYYDNTYNSGSGWYIANGDTTKRFAVDNNGSSEDNADGFGAFLLGQASELNANGYTTRALNFNYHAAYVQDDFKVTPKLTLNLGVRWDMETPVTERHNNLFFWNPNAQTPFQFASGWNWNSQLTAAGINPSSVPEPAWAQQGKFPNGAIVAVGTPEHPSRSGPGYNPDQFAPRIGAAYQLTSNTVVRGSVGEIYLSSTGNANAYQSGGQGFVTADALNDGWTNGGIPLVSNVTFSNPIPNPNALVTYTRDSTSANFQQTGGNQVPVVYALDTHQPREWDWNASVQRQVTKSLLIELQYNGNRGVGLLVPNDISTFPAAAFTGGSTQGAIYNTAIATPIANYAQTKWSATNELAFLEYPYPQYGPVRILGANEGRSLYNAFVFRAEKRYSNGVSFLGSYTWSRQKDNTGGPNVGADITNSSGTGGREVQSIAQLKDDYTISPLDHTHRVIFAGNVDLPFGKGRQFLSNPEGAYKLLDYVVGGWQLSGIYSFTSGAPLVLNFQTANINNGIGHIVNTWGSWATSDQNLAGNVSGYGSALVNQGAVETGTVNRILDPSKVVAPQIFVSGNLNPIYPGIRQPGLFDTDLALMKNFPISEGKRYLQIRAESTNAFNQRGYPNIDTTVGDPYFGQLVLNPNSSPRNPRVIQFSGRIVF